uniref:Uncharacterized protein n=1 Tax=Brassica oleracea TaxID=3712 RepID=A0A3P6F294_BRAOL|nr:unnamed protein product [Brassica oleracea]
MVFVDSRGDNIHGTVKKDEVGQFVHVLHQGQTKFLINFTVIHSGGFVGQWIGGDSEEEVITKRHREIKKINASNFCQHVSWWRDPFPGIVYVLMGFILSIFIGPYCICFGLLPKDINLCFLKILCPYFDIIHLLF